MAKKQIFGSEALQQKASARKMAKVVVSTKMKAENIATKNYDRPRKCGRVLVKEEILILFLRYF